MRSNWQRLIDIGWTEDLLPCAQPGTPISPASSIQELGKIPSIINASGYACGIKDWTSKIAELAAVKKWSENTNYGICVQTRRVRAIDIDIPDILQSFEISEYIKDVFGLNAEYPCRYRDGTGKLLIPLIVNGDLKKHCVTVSGSGIIEFLGNGNQFVAYGTHPSGSKYQWLNADNLCTLKEMTLDHYIELMDTITKKYEGGTRLYKAHHPVYPVAGLDSDPVVAYMADIEQILEQDGDKFFIKCPWEINHTTNNVTSTVYMQSGHNNQPSAFKCLHAHCAHRSTYDFLDAIGYTANPKDLPTDAVVSDGGKKPDKTTVTVGEYTALFSAKVQLNKDGTFKDDMCTIHAFIESRASPLRARYDAFTDKTMIAVGVDSEYTPITDIAVTNIRVLLQNKYNFAPVKATNCKDAINLLAQQNSYDSAKEWLTSLKWDGVKRIDRFCTDIMGCEDGDYAKYLSRYLFTAMAARIVDSGCMVRIVPIFISRQEMGKTSALRALAPSPDAYCSISMRDSDADLSRSLRGVLIAEWEEVRGMSARDTGALKAFISKQTDKWIPKFQEYGCSYNRRFVMIGTSNPGRFLDDPTGYSRFAPITVLRPVDWRDIHKIRDQLWVEGLERYKSFGGVEYLPLQEYLACNKAAIYEGFTKIDMWSDRVLAYLAVNPAATDEDIVVMCLGKTLESCSHRDAERISNIRIKIAK